MELSKHFIFFLILLVKVHQSLSQEGEWPAIVRPQGMGCLTGPICHMYQNNGLKALNCLAETEVDQSPKVLKDETAVAQLRELCSDTLDSYGEEPGGGYNLCCQAEHISQLSGQIEMAQGILQRCPSCWKNFKLVFCDLACSPYQKHFLRADVVEDTADYEADPVRPRMIRELGLYYTERYAQQTYDSCKDVKMGALNTPVMDFLCGGYGAQRCSPERWFGYLGDIQNSYTHTQINFRYKNESNEEDRNVTAYDGVTFPCHEARPGYYPCACVDCPANCPAAQDVPFFSQHLKIFCLINLVNSLF